MKKTRRKKYRISAVQIILLASAFLVLGLLLIKAYRAHNAPEPTVDPHAGMVSVFNGDAYMWIVPEDGLALNTMVPADFAQDSNGEPCYISDAYTTERGIDVSGYQGDIDWQAVADSGIDFAIIRAGGRYYGSGELYTDDSFAANFAGAKAAGIKVGVYFFSQAISAEEARQEAEYTLKILGDAELELPIMFDWEHVENDDARTDNIDGATLTDCAAAFCSTLTEAGYSAGIYLYSDTGYNGYELSRLSDYTFWASAIGPFDFFYYEHELWQYSFKGKVNGIDGSCDMDMMFIKNEATQ